MTADPFSIEGQSVVVTGSSQGIGRAMVERFAERGADVVVSSRDPETIEAVAEGINESDAAGDAIAVACDVREREEVEALVEATVDAFGGLDAFVNNAGASFVAPVEDITENGWDTIVDINLGGVYRCTQVAGAYMREQGGGVIVNLASVAGQRGSEDMSHYGAAKAGVINFTTSVAKAWADDDVRVNCIAPGLVATEGVRSQMGVDEDPDDRTRVNRTIGSPGEIADVAQFLASPASSYMVGETVTVKGVPRIGE